MVKNWHRFNARFVLRFYDIDWLVTFGFLATFIAWILYTFVNWLSRSALVTRILNAIVA